ncbi:hypothetical protein NKH77_27725 [Streptomyces sp. M19]
MHGAGTDPAYVPGLTPPPVEAKEPKEATEETAEETVDATDAEAEAERPSEDAAADTVDAVNAVDSAEDEPEAADEDDDEDDGGPVFEVADRRSSIVANRKGVTFRLDAEQAEFHWDEIGAVEIDTRGSAAGSA